MPQTLGVFRLSGSRIGTVLVPAIDRQPIALTSSTQEPDVLLFEAPKGERAYATWHEVGEAPKYDLDPKERVLILSVSCSDLVGTINIVFEWLAGKDCISESRAKLRAAIKNRSFDVPERATSFRFFLEFAGSGSVGNLKAYVSSRFEVAVSIQPHARQTAAFRQCFTGEGTASVDENRVTIDGRSLASRTPLTLHSTIPAADAAEADHFVFLQFNCEDGRTPHLDVYLNDTDQENQPRLVKARRNNKLLAMFLRAGDNKWRSCNICVTLGEGASFSDVQLDFFYLDAEDSPPSDKAANSITFNRCASSILKNFYDTDAERGSIFQQSSSLVEIMQGLEQIAASEFRELYRQKLAEVSYAANAMHMIESQSSDHGVEESEVVSRFGQFLVLPPRTSARGRLSTSVSSSADDNNHIAYGSHSALPHYSHGYSIRTHSIARSMRKAGWGMTVFTRRGFPDDLASVSQAVFTQSQHYEGAQYVTSRAHPLHTVSARDLSGVKVDTTYLVDQLSAFKPRLIHGASNWRTGLSAVASARHLSLPSVYEVRGLWHLTEAAKNPGFEKTVEFEDREALEIMTCQAADRLVTLTAALRDYLAELGIDPEKIDVLPNAVDVHKFEQREADALLKRRLGLHGKTIVGFIGSIVHYEGVQLVLEALTRLPSNIQKEVGVLIVGSGTYLRDLKRIASMLNVEENVVFTGRVPFDDVSRYYSIIDIAPFPRLPLKVCELVSPLKPFEAMAMGKAVLASNVASHMEFVVEGQNALSFQKGDIDDLAAKLEAFVVDVDMRKRIASAGRDWVLANRTWSQGAEILSTIYKTLI